MTQYTELVTRLEPFVQGLGKAILRETANAIEALEAEVVRLTAENSAKMATCKGIIQGLAAQLAAAQEQERALRRLFCASVSLGAYMDDGEASDASEWPHIDYLRDSPDDIRRKRQERGMKKLAAQAAQLAAAQGVPEGWKLVPVNPTPKMVTAGREVFGHNVEDTPQDYKRIYAAMLATAPQPKDMK